MRILIVTDAWTPQINGVVRTFTRIRDELQARGHDVGIISPNEFLTIPCPGYPEIALALWPGAKLKVRMKAFQPDAIHIATEGPLGFAARRYCIKHGLPFTSSYATRFPEYLSTRLPLPLSLGYAALRRFHEPSKGVMVATQTIRDELFSRNFSNIVEWTRGVDTELFRPRDKNSPEMPLRDLPRPVYLYVGRVAVEKNLEAFLSLDLRFGSRVVIGDGPQKAALHARYPKVHFLGARQGEDLARHYAAADVFVFPSRTDTFGLVMLEALASGVPVAAFPVPGPLDVIEGSGAGVLSEDLTHAIERALAIPPARCRTHAMTYSWASCTELFLRNLARIEVALSGDLAGSEAANTA